MRKKIDFKGASVILENELWRDVLGFEGIYNVSNYGRVKRLKRHPKDGKKSIMRDRILAPR